MKTRLIATYLSASFCLLAQQTWTVHDRNRPHPPVVTAGSPANMPPSDAVVLFDGRNADQFESVEGGAAAWKVQDGALTVVPRSGSIKTKQAFGDCQLHVEWASPNPPQGQDQGRGNSGIILMGMFEMQVLDSFHADTYADGQAAAVYGQYPPIVNASRPPGEWQTYDIIFHRPRFNEQGLLTDRARVTLLQNGVLVQDDVELSGPTAYHNRPPYFPSPDRMPFVLQDHGTPVRYRNIWIRELGHEPERVPVSSFVPLRPDSEHYQKLAGNYAADHGNIEIRVDGDHLTAEIQHSSLVLTPMKDDVFWARGLPGNDELPFIFSGNAVTVFLGGHWTTFTRK